MVSPSRKRKVTARPRLKDPSSGDRPNCNKGEFKKPLLKKRFFLDVRNRQDVSSLTRDLQKFGAIIDAFLSKEVNVIISDRPTPISLRSLNSRNYAGKNSLTNGTGNGKHLPDQRRLRSRGEAMLIQARNRKRGTSDILLNAERWGAEVWSLQKALDYIVDLKTRKQLREKTVISVHKLSFPFLKVEDCDGKFQPIYKELVEWPVLRLRPGTRGSPFAYSEDEVKKKSVTVKVENNDKFKNSAKRHSVVGNPHVTLRKSYCEICAATYTNLSDHLRCDTHIKFVENEKNFAQLDCLMVKEVPEPLSPKNSTKKEMGSYESVQRCLRSAKYPPSCRVKEEPKQGVVLRNGCISPDNRLSPCRSKPVPKAHEVPEDLTCIANGRNSRSNSALSDSEFSESDNESLASKRRSSALSKIKHLNQVTPVVKRGRGRPRKVPLEPPKPVEPIVTRASENNDDDEQSKRRFSGELRLLSDNQEYYKFEILSSKLRSTHRIHRRVSDASDSAHAVEPVEEAASEVCVSEPSVMPWMNEMQFSFENVPQTEPWYKTYVRQDEGEEQLPTYDYSAKKFLLPYELPPEALHLKPRQLHKSNATVSKGKRQRNSLLAAAEELPRKSPRCHASTLALLLGVKNGEEDPQLTEYLDFSSVDEETLVATGRELGYVVEKSPPRRKTEKVRDSMDREVTFDQPLDLTALMENYSQCTCLEDAAHESCSECTSTCDTASEPDSNLRRTKKRRPNLTGWPRDRSKAKKRVDFELPIAEELTASVPAKRGRKPKSEFATECSKNDVRSVPCSSVQTFQRREFPRQAKSQILVKVDYLPSRRKKDSCK